MQNDVQSTIAVTMFTAFIVTFVFLELSITSKYETELFNWRPHWCSRFFDYMANEDKLLLK